MASLHRNAAILLTLGLLAGCGGDRTRGGTSADTAGAAAVTPGSAAMPMKDTAGAPAPSPSAPTAAPTDTAKRPSAVAPATKAPATKPRAAHDAVSAPSAQASRDTARAHTAEPTRSATPTAAPTPPQQTPAPQPSAPKQDTSKAAQQDTSKPAVPQDTSKQAAAQQDTTQQEAPLRDAYHQPPRDTVDQATYDGWKQFNLNCARCHGEDALGTSFAPHLILSLKPDGPINTKELFVQTVCAGRPAKGMPAWCALGLDMGKINDIYLYVKGRSDAKLAPGRPAVKAGG